MWINPKFEVKVIKFAFDELIKYRNDAGDNYKLLTEINEGKISHVSYKDKKGEL